MANPTAALDAIKAAHNARSAAWASLQLAEIRLLTEYGPPRLGVARQALADALQSCDDMRTAITAAQAEVGKLCGKAADDG